MSGSITRYASNSDVCSNPGRQECLAGITRYAVKRAVQVLVYVIAGTLFVWLGVWMKVRAEVSATMGFVSWVGTELLGLWWVNGDDLRAAVEGMAATGQLIAAALVLSGAISLWLGWKTSQLGRLRIPSLLESGTSMMGGIPIFFLCFLVSANSFEMKKLIQGTWLHYDRLLGTAAVLILAFGEGNVGLWARGFRWHFEQLRKAPYLQAASGRGLSVRRLIWRDTSAMILESLGSRLVILLSGAAIVEDLLEMESGIGFSIIYAFSHPGQSAYSILAADGFVLVVFVAFVRVFDAVVRDWSRRRPMRQM